MSALARLRTVAHQLALDEQDDAYIEAIREYQDNATRRMRESWLLQESNVLVRRINIIRAKLIFAVEEQLSIAFLNRQLRKQSMQLDAYREELRKIRSEA